LPGRLGTGDVFEAALANFVFAKMWTSASGRCKNQEKAHTTQVSGLTPHTPQMGLLTRPQFSITPRLTNCSLPIRTP
jgi:hypothetical protein